MALHEDSTTLATEDEALEKILTRRHSTRAFLPDTLPEDRISRLFEIAQRTASWCNVQPWQVVVSTGEGAARLASKLSAYASTHQPAPDFDMPSSYQGEYATRRRETGYTLYKSIGIERHDREARAAQSARNFSFFGAPHVAIITTDRELGTYGAIDCGAYMSTLLIAAESLGIAAIPQAALAMHPGFIRNYFGLGDDRLVVAGVSFGLENTEHPVNGFRVGRAPAEEVVTWIRS